MESGYARVFTKERNEQRRIIALENRGLTGTLIADIVLRLLNYVAQPKELPAVHRAWLKKEISAREAARRMRVTHKTFPRWAHEL